MGKCLFWLQGREERDMGGGVQASRNMNSEGQDRRSSCQGLSPTRARGQGARDGHPRWGSPKVSQCFWNWPGREQDSR